MPLVYPLYSYLRKMAMLFNRFRGTCRTILLQDYTVRVRVSIGSGRVRIRARGR